MFPRNCAAVPGMHEGGDKAGSSLPTTSCCQGGVTINALLSSSRCCFAAPSFLREGSCSSCQEPFLIPHDGDGNHSPKLCLEEFPWNSQGLEAPGSFPAIAGICQRALGAVQTPNSAWNVELSRDWGSGAAAEGLKGAGTSGELWLYWRFECDCAKSPQSHPKVTLWWQGALGLLPQLSLTSAWPQPFPALLFLLFLRC